MSVVVIGGDYLGGIEKTYTPWELPNLYISLVEKL